MAYQGTERSSALLAAQEKLYRLRQERRAEERSPRFPGESRPHDSAPTPRSATNPAVIPPAVTLPGHLGWESAALTNCLRASRQTHDTSQHEHATQEISWPEAAGDDPAETAATNPSETMSGSVKLHPDVALGMLRQDQSAAGRIWLLLRHFDVTGKGWITTKQSRERLTSKRSDTRVCGWRQLRNLLAKGEGIFWHRTSDRIWLRSVAKVAAALDVVRLSGDPVIIPVDVLTQGIGTVRAHLYASFHSGRATTTLTGAPNSMPLARQTIRGICHISRRTQRNYERKANVRIQHNFAIGAQATIEMERETAWQHGRAFFRLSDRKGKHGAAGKTYVAWQLPNSYVGPHPQQPRGKQKRINQELADLFMQGMTGNGKALVASRTVYRSKRFFGSGRQAARAIVRPCAPELYWRSPYHQSRQGTRFWHYLAGRS